MRAYHDTEWGVPSHDERHLFEMVTLEDAQAGLSWSMVLKRRVGHVDRSPITCGAGSTRLRSSTIREEWGSCPPTLGMIDDHCIGCPAKGRPDWLRSKN